MTISKDPSPGAAPAAPAKSASADDLVKSKGGEIELNESELSNVSGGASGLTFSKIKQSYTPQSAGGTPTT